MMDPFPLFPALPKNMAAPEFAMPPVAGSNGRNDLPPFATPPVQTPLFSKIDTIPLFVGRHAFFENGGLRDGFEMVNERGAGDRRTEQCLSRPKEKIGVFEYSELKIFVEQTNGFKNGPPNQKTNTVSRAKPRNIRHSTDKPAGVSGKIIIQLTFTQRRTHDIRRLLPGELQQPFKPAFRQNNVVIENHHPVPFVLLYPLVPGPGTTGILSIPNRQNFWLTRQEFRRAIGGTVIHHDQPCSRRSFGCQPIETTTRVFDLIERGDHNGNIHLQRGRVGSILSQIRLPRFSNAVFHL